VTVTRRDALKLAAVAAATPLLPRGMAEAAEATAASTAGKTAAAAAGRFFSAPEMASTRHSTFFVFRSIM